MAFLERSMEGEQIKEPQLEKERMPLYNLTSGSLSSDFCTFAAQSSKLAIRTGEMKKWTWIPSWMTMSAAAQFLLLHGTQSKRLDALSLVTCARYESKTRVRFLLSSLSRAILILCNLCWMSCLQFEKRNVASLFCSHKLQSQSAEITYNQEKSDPIKANAGATLTRHQSTGWPRTGETKALPVEHYMSFCQTYPFPSKHKDHSLNIKKSAMQQRRLWNVWPGETLQKERETGCILCRCNINVKVASWQRTTQACCEWFFRDHEQDSPWLQNRKTWIVLTTGFDL